MTSTRYFICLAAQALGYRQNNMRMLAAAEETHLLKEAEFHLGLQVWEKVENIEALSIEYWNLRKLITHRDHVAAELQSRQEKLTSAHEERSELIGASNQPLQDLMDQRQSVINSLEVLARERDVVVSNAQKIRRAYQGMRTKQEVLAKNAANEGEVFSDLSNKLLELKSEFQKLKEEREILAEKIVAGDTKITQIDAEMLKQKKGHREKASEAYQFIGDANQEISKLRAELSTLDVQMRLHYTEIGKYVSRMTSDPECRKACKHMLWLVDIMAALRKSIYLNHKLAGNA